MRRTYETERDRDNEKRIMGRLGKYFEEVVKLPHKSVFDYAEIGRSNKGGKYIRNFIEIKKRSNPKEQYPTYMISSDKIRHAFSYINNFNVGFKLVVEWKDKTGIYTLRKNDSFNLGCNGRFDRGDWQDVDPVVYIPIGDFYEVERLP